MRWIAPLLLAAALLAGPSVPESAAQTAPGTGAVEATAQVKVPGEPAVPPAQQLDQWDSQANRIEQQLQQPTIDAAEIEAMRGILDAQRNAIPAMLARGNTQLSPLKDQLAALGEAPKEGASEAPEVSAERARLTDRIATVEALVKRAGQADARATALQARLADLRRRLFTRELMTRGPSIFDSGVVPGALASVAQVLGTISGETSGRLATALTDGRPILRWLVTLALIAGAFFALVKIKRTLLRKLVGPAPKPGPKPGPGPAEPESAPSPAAEHRPKHRGKPLTGSAVALVRLLVPSASLAMAAGALLNSGLLGPQGVILLEGIAWAVLVVIAAYALGGGFYAPRYTEFRLSSLPDDEARAAAHWLMALAAVVGLNQLFIEKGPDLGLSIEALEFFNTVLICAGGVVLWRFSAYLHGPPAKVEVAAPGGDDAEAGEEPRSEFEFGPAVIAVSHFIARFVAVAAPALALLGYFAASRFMFYPMVLTGAVIGVCVLLFSRVQDVVERLGRDASESGPSGAEARPSRAQLIPVTVGFLLVCAATPVLALVWGADASDLANAWRLLIEGFKVGDFSVSPVQFFWFLLVFSVGYMITRLVQGVLTRSVLPVTGLDAGGRAAVRAGVGYVGVVISALAAISATGLDLSNLAIVAGALSVGIGFGMQNIVNNFVSGIILLIERPIKSGDWVQLGSGSGYVKRINVRSTEIETFDRASLIVPNSELIAGPVTNWTHTNLNGRIIVPVGVAYGTDPRKVEEILTEIAKAQTMILKRPAPYVLFRRFGADALEFEIRGVLRDVNWILNVTSDINYEIARRFAEAGIEIPFAQRDLHLRNAGDIGESIAGALRKGTAPSGESAGPTGESGAGAPAKPARRRKRGEAAGPDGDT